MSKRHRARPRSLTRRPTFCQAETSSLSRRTFPLRESIFPAKCVIGKEASGIHDTPLQYFMKGDVATRKELHAVVVLSVCTNMFQSFLGTHDEGIDSVDSIHGEIKVATPIRYGLEDSFVFPQLSKDFDFAGRVRSACPERPKFEKYDIHMLKIRLGSMTSICWRTRSGSLTSICPSGLHCLVPDRH